MQHGREEGRDVFVCAGADLQIVGCQGAGGHEDGCDVLEALPCAGQLPLQRQPHLPRPPLQNRGLSITNQLIFKSEPLTATYLGQVPSFLIFLHAPPCDACRDEPRVPNRRAVLREFFGNEMTPTQQQLAMFD